MRAHNHDHKRTFNDYLWLMQVNHTKHFNKEGDCLMPQLEHMGSEHSQWFCDINHPNLSFNKASKIIHNNKEYYYAGFTTDPTSWQFKSYKKDWQTHGYSIRTIKLKRYKTNVTELYVAPMETATP